jgi:DNA-binding Lrp family transcriptional regulator
MRPIARQRSPLVYPLDSVLGSEANVRVLRLLIYVFNGALSVPMVAKLTALTPEGARKALERLEAAGVVRRSGSGRAQTYSPTESSLVGTLFTLFEKEEQRYDEFVATLKDAVSGVSEVRSSWIRRLPVQLGGSIDLVVVVSASALPWIADELRSRVTGLERDYDLIVEISAYTAADAPEAEAESFVVSLAQPEGSGSQRPGLHVHAGADQRSLAVAGAVAELMGSDPTLISRARQHVKRLLQDGQGMASADVAEWGQILDVYSPERVRQLLTSTSSRAARLRQSSPFFAVLTVEQRDRVFDTLDINET